MIMNRIKKGSSMNDPSIVHCQVHRKNSPKKICECLVNPPGLAKPVNQPK